MDFLLDPNIAYLLLVAAMMFSLLAIMTPGTGVPEILAVFSSVLAGYAVYHLSFNWWALALIILSIVPFWFSLRGPRRAVWLIVSMVGLTAGSIFFFPAAKGLISVNPVLALATTIAYSAFLWVAVRKVVETARSRPVHRTGSSRRSEGRGKDRGQGRWLGAGCRRAVVGSERAIACGRQFRQGYWS